MMNGAGNIASSIGGASVEDSSLRGSTVGEAAAPTWTSTTKALMLSIAVPRIYRIYIPPKEQPEAAAEAKPGASDMSVSTKDTASTAGASHAVHPLLRDKPANPASASNAPAKEAGEGEPKPHRLLGGREEVPFLPDDHDPTTITKDTASKTSSIHSAISKVATLLVGEGDEADPDDDDHDEYEEEKKEDVRFFEVESERNNSESIKEHRVGYVEGDEEEGGRHASIVEHVITSEEMAMIVKIAASEEELLEPVPEEEPTHSHYRTDSSIITAASDAIKSFFGVVNPNNDNTTAYLSRDEAVAAIKHYDPATRPLSHSVITELEHEDSDDETIENGPIKPNTEIKMEELLRLTFRNLYMENHFYNAPIYTNVTTKMLQEAEMDDWVELSVMAKQASIGIILERLERIGVGSSVGTIAIYKTELLRACDILNDEAPQEAAKPSTGAEDTSVEDGEKAAKIEAARAEWKNAASRLRVEQVKEQIEEQAELSLDYLALLTIASILAGIGLVTDNAVVIVASMLVSPIMGPVMGMTFGSQVLDWGLTTRSCWHEFLSLLLAVMIGAVIGVTTSFCPSADTWPTEQMSSRGDTTGLIAGIAIAIPSGMGVALSILGNNTSSLVGVAISASLLPPAVNAGILWVFAILIRIGAVDAPNIQDNDGNPYDYNLIAVTSFALTMVNIVCIWVSGMLMFRIKEVAPTRSKSAFWSRDIKVARAIQKGSKDVNLDVIKAGLQDAIKKERDQEKAIVRQKQHKRHKHRGDIPFNIAVNPEVAPVLDVGDFERPASFRKDSSIRRNNNTTFSMRDMADLLGVDSDDSDDETVPAGVRRRRV